jgi:putative ABC transport system permease protein
MVPLFTTPPATFPVDLQTAWGPALLAGAVGVVALTIVGLVTSRRVARRASLERLRETV